MMKLLPLYFLLFLCVQGFTQKTHARKVVIYGPVMDKDNADIRQSVVNGVTNALWSCGFQARLNPERDKSSDPYDISKIEKEVQEVLLKLYKDNEPIDANDQKLLDKFKENIDTDTIVFTAVNWISRNNTFMLTARFYDLNTLRYVNQIIEMSFAGDAIYESENIEYELFQKLQLSSFCFQDILTEKGKVIEEVENNKEELQRKKEEQKKKEEQQKEEFDLLIIQQWENPNDIDLLWEIEQIKLFRNDYFVFLNRRTIFYQKMYKKTQFEYNQLRNDILNQLIKDYIKLHFLARDNEVKKIFHGYIELFKNELEKTPNNNRR